jgi:ABC-type uncharacterized transport system permease subunit
MKNSSFYFHWLSFLLGLFLGIFGFFIALFSITDRRDKIYSSLFGWFLGTGIVMLLWHYGAISMDFT